jgi:hypothetical protein
MTQYGFADANNKGAEPLPLETQVELLNGTLFRYKRLAARRQYNHNLTKKQVVEALDKMEQLILSGYPLKALAVAEELKSQMSKRGVKPKTND